MALITGAYLNQQASQKTFSANERLMFENKSDTYGFDIFLSHSFLDRQKVQGLFNLLTSLGYTVYVDWICDPQLNRNDVTKATAELVRKRMKASKSLLLAISTNAALSKWIPWELGYIDGHINKCAIVPVSDDSVVPKQFHRAEYLSLYPYIKRATINFREGLYLVESGNIYISIDGWLKRNLNPLYESVNIDNI